MPNEYQFSVSPPSAEVRSLWDRARGGYPNTVFAIAAIGAIRLLDRETRDSLMAVAGAVAEKRAGADILEDWIAAQKTVRDASTREAGTRKGMQRKRQKKPG